MKNVTTIIPIHKIDNTTDIYLDRAIDSIADKENVIIVCPMDVLQSETERLSKKYENNTFTFVHNGDKTDFASQVNLAVMHCTTKYFTILEFDDVFLPQWERIFEKQINNSHDSLYLSFNRIVKTKDLNTNDFEFMAFANVIPWDAAILLDDDELGYINSNTLQVCLDFNLSGAIFNTEKFISLGKLNPERKIYAFYDYLVRLTADGSRIYTIPQVTYDHTLFRTDSYADEMSNTLTPDTATAIINEIQKQLPNNQEETAQE